MVFGVSITWIGLKGRGGNMYGFISATYLLHYVSRNGSVRGEQDVPHQHWFEEGPGDGSSRGVDHLQVHVHAEGTYRREEEEGNSF